MLAALFSACGDTQVAGTSSGVDNPSLTVGFRDASGTALRITGDLNVYAVDQNPAVDPQPLVTIKVKNSAFTNLTGEDFKRLQLTAGKQSAQALAKPAAAALPAANSTGNTGKGDSTSTSFNIVLKTQDRTGSLVIGLKYDSSAREFSRVGGAALTRLDVQPRPLVRYQAKLVRDSLHGNAGRIFVPGTPFLATLVDSLFVIDDMPEGIFPIRLLTADGKVYPIGDSLDTKDSTRIYHPSDQPVGLVDTTGRKDSLPDFTVHAGSDQEAVLELPAFLEAGVTGLDKTDPRLTCLWRQIKQAGDSGRRDTLVPVPPLLDTAGPIPAFDGKAAIFSPTSLRSEVRFPQEGVYQFEIACTLGLRIRLDTVVFSVRRLPPPPRPRIIQPRPGDTLVADRAYTVQWEMPDKGPVKVQVSVNNGETWLALAEHYPGKDGLPILPWTPARSLGVSAHCLIQVTSDADTSLHASMEGAFNLLQ